MDSKQTNDVDKSIAKQMRTTNYEQFKSLVRMHLSFELDLNTDEFDLPCHEIIYYEKGKVKKWNRLSKKMKGCTSGAKVNSPPEAQSITLTGEIIKQLRVLKDFLMQKENIVQEGIFRRTGAISRQNEIRQQINLNKNLDIAEGFTVHDCATVYKGCLADLVEPLLTDAHYPAHCQIADLCNLDGKSTNKVKQDHLLHSVQLLMLLLPEANRLLFEDIIDMLHDTMKYESSNKMSADSLATLFAPHLICPRNLPAEALHYVSQNMSSVISYMIVQGGVIFDIPPKLATDIRAYSLEQKRKRTMSPEKILDESTSDISTVNTVYTFIDREKTAEAHNSNPTDTALAQLYAHIQSLPESSKKRKLIKQFNKENGQGTPLQFLVLNRLKTAGSSRSARSIGDSIKKHIFQRNVAPRTPKRTPGAFECSESIMTPRSRKPVLLTTNIGLLDHSQSAYQGDLSSFREQDEDSFLVQNASVKILASPYRPFSENNLDVGEQNRNEIPLNGAPTSDSLTNTFREYLLGRSVLTTSPVDESFSSQSDDFGSTLNIRDLNESEMSSSLLCFLNGKHPESLSGTSSTSEYKTTSLNTASISCAERLTKKRMASSKLSLCEKEQNDEKVVLTTKVLVLEKNPNETSL